MTRKSFAAAIAVFLLTAAVLFSFPATRAAMLAPYSDTFAGGVSGTMTRGQIPKVSGPSQIADSSISDNGTTVSVSEPVAAAGKVTITRDPASTANTNASLVVNPATSATNELYLALLDNGTTVFSADKEGDVVILGGITMGASGNKFTVASASGNTAVAGTLAVTGAATFTSSVTATGSINGPFGAARVVGSTQLITAAMSGQLFAINNASDAATVNTLPAASTAGLRYCFTADAVTGSNREVDVETPAGSDLIIGTTNPAGATGIATTAGASHGIKNTHATAVRGNSVCIQSDGVNTWYMTSLSGTWAAY